jgi:hypothetical protein
MANVGTAGYFGGGGNESDGSLTSRVDKLSFSNDTISTLGTGLSQARGKLGAMANNGVAAYFGGGNAGAGGVTTVDKFALPADTRSTLGTGLSGGRYDLSGMANSGVAGYFGYGGLQGVAFTTNTIHKFSFADDTRSTFTGSQTVARNAAMANEG